MTKLLDARRDASGGYTVDVGRGERIGRVSSEWFSPPADERYLSLSELYASVRERTERSRTRTVESAAIRVEASRSDPERLSLMLPGAHTPVAPTHWSFGQLASLVGAPAAYLRQLPAPLAGINLQYGLTSHRPEQVKTLEIEDGRVELRAVTGPDYGRIFDHGLVAAVQRIAGNGTGDTRWKVPGVLDWSTGVYNPRVDIAQDTTTLYASDRDVFLFLVDDLNPIEAGRLSDGSPDLYFRGFYCWNSEVGAKTLGMASFYLRAVCQNRNLWGVEDFEEITIRHSKYAASRFPHETAPALTRFANSSAVPFINGMKAARERIVAKTDEDRSDFLRLRGFSRAETTKIIETVLADEGRPPETVFDFVQGITAVARDKPHQDARLDLEGRARKTREIFFCTMSLSVVCHPARSSRRTACALGYGRGDLVEMGLHGPCIGEGHDESRADATSRTDRPEEVGALVALIGGLARPGSASRPLPDQAVLLADPGLVLQPDLDPLALRDMSEMGLQRRRVCPSRSRAHPEPGGAAAR